MRVAFLPSQVEVDFIWRRGKNAVGFEVKAASEWRGDFGKPLKTLFNENKISKCYGIYTGKTMLKDGPVEILPIGDFCTKLGEGRILG